MNNTIYNHFSSLKAGVDSKTIQNTAHILSSMVAGTPKQLREAELDRIRNMQIQNMKKTITRFESFQESQKQEIQKSAQRRLNQLKSNRDLSRYWAHFDFDMFYIAVQLLQRPQLRDKPCCVSGRNGTGVICSSNYVARKQGIRSAMPCFIANKLCPELIHFPCNFEKYQHYSKIFRQIISQYDQNYQSQGLDQVYIDLTDYINSKKIPVQSFGELLKEMRNKIFQSTKLTVSCGMGANKLLSKLSSEINKPDNQFILSNDQTEILKFVGNHQIRKLPGIGPVNQKYLHGLGIYKGSEIIQRKTHLRLLFSDNAFDSFLMLALGISRNYHQHNQRKSISRQVSFQKSNDISYFLEILNQIAQNFSIDLQNQQCKAGNIAIILQSSEFIRKQKTFELERPISKFQQVMKAVQSKCSFFTSYRSNEELNFEINWYQDFEADTINKLKVERILAFEKQKKQLKQIGLRKYTVLDLMSCMLENDNNQRQSFKVLEAFSNLFALERELKSR